MQLSKYLQSHDIRELIRSCPKHQELRRQGLLPFKTLQVLPVARKARAHDAPFRYQNLAYLGTAFFNVPFGKNFSILPHYHHLYAGLPPSRSDPAHLLARTLGLYHPLSS